MIFYLVFILIMASTTSSGYSDDDEQSEYTFPKTLDDFGFSFNEDGELKDKDTGQGFNFVARDDDRKYNQKRYEALGEIITDYVYELLEKEGNLKKHYIPVDAEENEGRSFIFMSDDALTNSDKLLVIIHGSGVVRAGQWSRKLIINNNLDKGTQLPYIRKAQELGYGVIVLNTNLNKVNINGKEHPIRENETPEEHGIYVWKHFVQESKAKHIGIVAHSYGGIVTLEMAKSYPTDFISRVFAVGFTDSVHSLSHQFTDSKTDAPLKQFFKERAVNYVSNQTPLGTKVESFEEFDCPCISAGTGIHELTSWSCFDVLFTFVQDRYKVFVSGSKSDEKPTLSKTLKSDL